MLPVPPPTRGRTGSSPRHCSIRRLIDISLAGRTVATGSLALALLVTGCAAPSATPSGAPQAGAPGSTSGSPAGAVVPVVRDSTLSFDDGSSAALRVTAGTDDLVAFAVAPEGSLDLGDLTVDVSVDGSSPVSVPVARQGRAWSGSARLRPGTWTVEVSGTSDADGFSTTLTARTSVNLSEASP